MFSSKEMQKLTLKLFPLFPTLKRLPLKTVVQMVYTDAFTIYYIGHIACFRKKGNKTGWKLDCYSRVPNNRRSWNNKGGGQVGGRLDEVEKVV